MSARLQFGAWLFCGGIVMFTLLLAASPVLAHKPSDSYLALSPEGNEVLGQWDIALRDLDYAIGLDADDDGAITWNELRTREADIAAYALARLHISVASKPCTLKPGGLLVDQHSDGAYAVLRFSAGCDSKVSDLTVDYRLFFDLDPLHRGLMRLTANGITRTAIFSPERATQQLDGAVASPINQFFAFVREGVWHIWIGIDHLLFLIALLLPAMLVRTSAGWKPVANSSVAFWNVFKIVTAFTVAHSITLSLAALEVVSLPSRWVETAIAASVLLAALNNLYPVVRRRLWVVAFVFGLIHGFGFASVLLDLGLPRNALVLSLFGFNLGVELGQLMVVVLYFVFTYAIRSTRLYGRAMLSGGSVVIAIIALAWMLERGLDMKLLPF
jgi:hypothetical protein